MSADGHGSAEPMGGTLLGRYILVKLDAMIEIVAGLDDGAANTVPALPGANSPYQLLTHVLGMARQWIRADIHGQETGRDREAEFDATGPVEALVARAHRERAELAEDLDRLAPDAPVRGRPGYEQFWADSVEGILLHVFEELCQHLGHLEITRDVIVAGRGRESGTGTAPPEVTPR